MPPRLGRLRGRRRALALILLVAATSCTHGRPAARVLRPAPEPARAPAPAAIPTGRVLALGDTPEGVAIDPTTGLVVVAMRRPDRLAILDGRAGRLLRVIAVPASARHLVIAVPGAPVLVPGEDSDLLVKVALPAGNVVGSVKVGRQPHDAATTGDRTFVTDELGSSVSVVAGGRVIHRFAGPVQPGGVAAAGDRVGVVDVRGAMLFVYDAGALRELARLPAGDGPTHAVALDDTRVVVADTRGSALLVYAMRPTPRQLIRLPLPGAPYGLAFDKTRNALWVTLTSRNELLRYDGSSMRRIGPALPTVRQPNSVAVDRVTGRVFVAGAVRAGELELIDP